MAVVTHRLRRSSTDTPSQLPSYTSTPFFEPRFSKALRGRYQILFSDFHQTVVEHERSNIETPIRRSVEGFDRVFICEILKAFYPVIRVAQVIEERIIVHLFQRGEERIRDNGCLGVSNRRAHPAPHLGVSKQPLMLRRFISEQWTNSPLDCFSLKMEMKPPLFSCSNPSFHEKRIDNEIQGEFLRSFQHLEWEIIKGKKEGKTSIHIEWNPLHDIDFTALLVEVIYPFVSQVEYHQGFLLLKIDGSIDSPISFNRGVVKSGETRLGAQDFFYRKLARRKELFKAMKDYLDEHFRLPPSVLSYRAEIIRFFVEKLMEREGGILEDCKKELLSNDVLLKPIRFRVAEFKREVQITVLLFGEDSTVAADPLQKLDQFLAEVHSPQDLKKFLNDSLKGKDEKRFFQTICGGKEVIKELQGTEKVLEGLFEEGKRIARIQQTVLGGKELFDFTDDRVGTIIRSLNPSNIPLKHIRYNGEPIDFPSSEICSYFETLAAVVQVNGSILNITNFSEVAKRETLQSSELQKRLMDKYREGMHLPPTLKMMTFEAYLKADKLLRENYPKLFKDEFHTKTQNPQTQILDIEKKYKNFRVTHRVAFLVFRVLDKSTKVVDETKPLARFNIAWTLPGCILSIKDLELTELGALPKHKGELLDALTIESPKYA